MRYKGNEAQTLDPEILEKTSQSEPHPLDLPKSWKKPHNSTDLLVGWLVVGWFRQAVQRPPAGAIIILIIVLYVHSLWFRGRETSGASHTASLFR